MTNLLPSEANARADVESGEYERYYQMRPGDRVLDLGAHVGYFTKHAAERVGPSGWVMAFEPEKTNFEALQERSRSFCQVELNNAGASNVAGEVMLWLRKGNSGGNSYYPDGDPLFHKYQLSTVVDIGHWCCVRGFYPDFVKIDTEGSEAAILRSLLFANLRPHIAFEAHSERLWNECREILLSYSYEAIANPVCVVGVNWGRPQ